MKDSTWPPLVDVYGLADAVQLPAEWLKKEAKAGLIPCLRVRRKQMFSVSAVRDALLERAAEPSNITNSESDATVHAGAD